MKTKIMFASFLATTALVVFFVSAQAAGSAIPDYISVQARQSLILAASAIIVIVTVASYFLSGARAGEENGLWRTAILFSIMCLTGISAVLYTVVKSSPDENAPEYYNLIPRVNTNGECPMLDMNVVSAKPNKDTPIHVRFIGSQKDVNCLQEEQNKLAQQKSVDAPIFVPTGVFIQSLEFTSANDAVMTGYVWQRYPKNMTADIERGFIMPEGDSDIYALEDAAVYRKEQGDEVVLGWYVATTLRQTFDYSHYPFDRQDIWLRLWHVNFDRNVILVPDLKAYDAVDFWTDDTETFLGVERDFVLERYTLERTYFNYHYNNYNTDFGIDTYAGQTAFPELYFNVGVKRDVMDAFVAYMIPMVILVLMAFGVQFIVTQIPDKMSMHGISTTGLIGYYASLFFIGVLAQLDIRRTLNAPGVVYLEYFYFILYIILLLQTVNSVIFAATDDVGWLEYKDNLYPKVIFFPITLGLMFIVTAYLFY